MYIQTALRMAAKKGVGFLFSATKNGLSALSVTVGKAKKSYSNNHERGVLSELRNRGLPPQDLIFEVLQKVYFLYMAGYKHEVVASAMQTGKRLSDTEKSSIPLDLVAMFGSCVCEQSMRYGDFERKKFKQTMEDFISNAKAGKEHFDRDALVHDFYYSVLLAAEMSTAELEQIFREAADRVVGDATRSAAGNKAEARKKAAKALYLFGSQVRSRAEESEARRQKALRDAEAFLHKEQERQLGSQMSHLKLVK